MSIIKGDVPAGVFLRLEQCCAGLRPGPSRARDLTDFEEMEPAVMRLASRQSYILFKAAKPIKEAVRGDSTMSMPKGPIVLGGSAIYNQKLQMTLAEIRLALRASFMPTFPTLAALTAGLFAVGKFAMLSEQIERSTGPSSVELKLARGWQEDLIRGGPTGTLKTRLPDSVARYRNAGCTLQTPAAATSTMTSRTDA